MFATNVRNLKKNPSEALRQARKEPVLILKGNQPDSLLMYLEGSISTTRNNLRPALAASLYKDEVLSLGAAAKLSALSLPEFVEHLNGLDIEIVKPDNLLKSEKGNLDKWLQQD